MERLSAALSLAAPHKFPQFANWRCLPIRVPFQNNICDSGIFSMKFIEFYDGEGHGSLLLVEGSFIPEDGRHSNLSQPQGPLSECAFILSNIPFPRREVHPQLIPILVGQQQLRRTRRPRWQVKKQQETLRMKPSYFRCNKISWSHFWTLNYTM